MFGVLACLRARVLGVLTCLRARRTCVLGVPTCLRVYVLGVFTCLRAGRAYVLAYLRVSLRACYNEMFYFLTCLCTWCSFLSYLLCISTLKFKNSHSKKLCALLS